MPSLEDIAVYQWEAVNFLEANPFSALWLDMGLGKTVSVLTLLARLIREERCSRILIVAPIKVAVQTWPTEIKKWDHTRHLEYTVIRPTGDEPEISQSILDVRRAGKALGLPSNIVNRFVTRAETNARWAVRERLLKEDTPIHIINREALFWLVHKFGRKLPYDTIIFDESSGLRDHKSDRWKAMAFARGQIKRHHQMTGSPAPESYLDVFPQVYLLDQGERFGRSITHFRETYFIPNPKTRSWRLRPGCENTIIDKCSGIVLDMKAADYLPDDEPVVLDRYVELSKAEREIYRRLETEFLLTMPNGIEIEAETAGALAQKLLQFASGTVYDTERNSHPFHAHKIEELKLIEEEAVGSPLLVAYWFKSSLARIMKAFPKAVPMDKEGKNQHPWNRGEIKMMPMHPASGGHGLNLQDGGHNVVWFDTCYSYELYDQFNRRIRRQGQKHVVTISHIITRGTLDATIVPKLKKKEKSQDYLFARLKYLRKQAEKRK